MAMTQSSSVWNGVSDVLGRAVDLGFDVARNRLIDVETQSDGAPMPDQADLREGESANPQKAGLAGVPFTQLAVVGALVLGAAWASKRLGWF